MFGGGDDVAPPKSVETRSVESANEKVASVERRVKELEKTAAKEYKAAQAYGAMAAQATTEAQRTSLKKKGMAALKRAKMYEGHTTKTGAIVANFESMTLETESMVATRDMVDGMKGMHTTMQGLSTQINPDDVSTMMHEIQETTDEFADIMNTLSKPLGGTTLYDVVSAEDEFDQMMAEETARLQEKSDLVAIRALEALESTDKQKKPRTHLREGTKERRVNFAEEQDDDEGDVKDPSQSPVQPRVDKTNKVKE